MKLPRPLHTWNVTPARAVSIQRELATRLIRCPPRRRLRTVAGADVAFSPDGSRCVAGVVIWDLENHCVLETQTATRAVTFPYVPGLLSFREAPAILAAIRKLTADPNVFLFDGQGYAHPRRFGLASHVGLLIDRPSIGCGKSRLVGTHAEPGARRGDQTPLLHDGEPIGVVLRTRDGVKPVYVSIGHRMNLRRAVEVVLACCTRYRIPEPTRLADQLVGRSRTTL